MSILPGPVTWRVGDRVTIAPAGMPVGAVTYKAGRYRGRTGTVEDIAPSGRYVDVRLDDGELATGIIDCAMTREGEEPWRRRRRGRRPAAAPPARAREIDEDEQGRLDFLL